MHKGVGTHTGVSPVDSSGYRSDELFTRQMRNNNEKCHSDLITVIRVDDGPVRMGETLGRRHCGTMLSLAAASTWLT